MMPTKLFTVLRAVLETAGAGARHLFWQASTLFFLIAVSLSPALALDPAHDEKKLLSSCEEKLCRQILDKSPPKGVLRCDLGKTWGGDDINKGAKTKSISWGFGDAQCSVDLKFQRRDIVQALTAPKYEFSVQPHIVSCTVETSEGIKPLRARLAPKLKFEGGRAKKVWIKLKDIDGPEPLSSFVWTTAKLEDTFGIFHSEMIKQINKFVHQKCEQRYGLRAMQKKKRLEAAKKRRAAALKAKKKREAIRAKRKKAAAAKKAKRASDLKEQNDARKKNDADRQNPADEKAARPTPSKTESASPAAVTKKEAQSKQNSTDEHTGSKPATSVDASTQPQAAYSKASKSAPEASTKKNTPATANQKASPGSPAAQNQATR